MRLFLLTALCACLPACRFIAAACRFKGLTQLVHVGYGSDKATRHRMPNGFYKFTIHNVKGSRPS